MKKRFLTLRSKLSLGMFMVVFFSIFLFSTLYYLEGLGDAIMLKKYSLMYAHTTINPQTNQQSYYLDEDYLSFDRKRHREIFFITSIFFLVLLLGFWLFIRKYINKPIEIVLKSLKNKDVIILEKIKSNNVYDEWSLLANLVKDNINQTKQLESLVTTKNKFFDLIAHDLRSPFNVITGFTDLLVDDQKSLDSKETQEYLGYILHASQNASKLLDRLLDWARLQTGRWTPNPKPFVIDSLVENVFSFHQSNALHHKIDFLLNCKDSLQVYADERMVEVALRNVVSNAIKFTPPGGSVHIDVKKHLQNVVVTITDTGKGMAPTIVKNLFKIGENVVAHDVSGKVGTGLGLLLSEYIITKNGGKIWVESELGKGSTFYFTIPLHV